jgi:hypothetical protein
MKLIGFGLGAGVGWLILNSVQCPTSNRTSLQNGVCGNIVDGYNILYQVGPIVLGGILGYNMFGE